MHVLCGQRCSSAELGCEQCLFDLLLLFYGVQPLWPLTSDINKASSFTLLPLTGLTPTTTFGSLRPSTPAAHLHPGYTPPTHSVAVMRLADKLVTATRIRHFFMLMRLVFYEIRRTDRKSLLSALVAKRYSDDPVSYVEILFWVWLATLETNCFLM